MPQKSFFNFFQNIGGNIRNIFRGKNLIWQLLAIALTYTLVASGFDWKYAQSTDSIAQNIFFFPALVLGGILPIAAPLSFYITGRIRKNVELLKIAFTLGEAAILGSFISSTYKAFTGRAHPEVFSTGPAIDLTRDFNFGFFREGIFWGWPSSHTTIAFAMAVSLVVLFPKDNLMRYSAILYALYIGIGVSVNVHWFSDFIAGAIMGTIIGIVVGKSFENFGSRVSVASL